MSRKPDTELRRGWTTGACATAAVQAALGGLWEGRVPGSVQITLPRGETPVFEIAKSEIGDGWAYAAVIKDAGDDPDVTHHALIEARVDCSSGGIVFKGGQGIGHVTRPGLPIAVGEPAINPVPRQMMQAVVVDTAARLGERPDITITLSVPNGAELAEKTWNPRLGILGGLSILGTTGIVRPFSCAAWIASIHRGVDVARAEGLGRVAGCTGATSERVVQDIYGLPDHAMLDMGDFVGGMLKYIAKHPVPHVTIGGGIGKMTKLAQGARDLHSGRSQVDLKALALVLARPEVADMNTALQAYDVVGSPMADWVARNALLSVRAMLPDSVGADVVVIDRKGEVLARA
ncbi:MAG: cobalt-precorrin-5B (C(1))-methyltransferase [Planktotalea sp.]|uniref:cobalt-precorrin-5B (C(1))-methyltransferase n=1 Tax=Planktotalea sp. TaxID=2029877 RepID=UPI003C70958F